MAKKKGFFSGMFSNKEVFGWVMYDWANSAFATTIMAAVLPVYYSDVAAVNLAPNIRTAYWGYTTSFAMLLVALSIPLLGAIADHLNAKKRFLRFFAYLGCLATTLLVFIETGDYLFCSILYIIGNLGFACANVFYDSLLINVAAEEDMDRVSSAGYAMGYLGGGLLLIINLVMILFPEKLGIPAGTWPARLSFVSVGIWWLIFSIPIFRYVKEGKSDGTKRQKFPPLSVGFTRLGNTYREASKYKHLFRFIVAFWLYNDGIGTIMRMATIYGREIGIDANALIGALLLTQFVAFPFSFLFGWIAQKINTKKAIYLTLIIYSGIVCYGFFLDSAFDFWILAFMVGTVQGGAQALSRSLYASMVPKHKSAEFFSFMGISSKFAAIVGPLVFAVVGQITGSSRNGIVSLVLFFILGMVVLRSVDVDEGRRIAQIENAQYQ